MSQNPFGKVNDQRGALKRLALRVRNLERRAGQAGALPSCSCSLDVGSGSFDPGGGSLPIDVLATSSSQVFKTGIGDTPDALSIMQDGFYLVAGQLGFSAEQDLVEPISLGLAFGGPDESSGGPANGWNNDLAFLTADGDFEIKTSFLSGVTFVSLTAGEYILPYVQCSEAIDNVSHAAIAVVQLNGEPLF